MTLAYSTIMLGTPNNTTLNEYTINILSENKVVSTQSIYIERLAPHTIYVNEQAISDNEQIINYKGSIYVPLESFSKILGAMTYYMEEQKVAMITMSNTKIEIPIGYNKAISIINSEKPVVK